MTRYLPPLLLTCLWAAPAAADCPNSIVTGIDVSASISHDELLMQVDGMVAALHSPAVISAIQSRGCARFSVFVWGDQPPVVLLPWTDIGSDEQVEHENTWRRGCGGSVPQQVCDGFGAGDGMTSEQRRIADLQHRLEEAEGRIVELEATFGLEDNPQYRTAGFTAQEGRALSCLLACDVVTRDQLLFAMYRDSPEKYERYEKIADVWICKLRKKLNPLGISIETVWGLGKRIPSEDKVKLRGMFQ
jgi:Protein of unknown function (DUF1194)